MDSSRVLVVRDDYSSSETMNPMMRNLLIALIVLGFAAMGLAACLYVLRQLRKRNARRNQLVSELPIYNERGHQRSSNHRRLTITTTASNNRESVFVIQEKENLMANSHSPPSSPIPEIRITFPEEVDDQGKRQSGRVVVVRVGEHSVGLEPVNETLPPYQESDSDRFHSLDLDRIGGLKEKDMR
ncbi:hypothetical protein NA57DRAFT_77750 [Rhizodiscina lignyota]|uniref:Uncharacterized protein n=1 Tax=Rhizodiscina lignyota TaxID=1504668 RepID=A0A9P4IDT3_9PEZI|nr:hypothetical protein NA57DRAFT_77750 [Rhizodiscina lignyota]